MFNSGNGKVKYCAHPFARRAPGEKPRKGERIYAFFMLHGAKTGVSGVVFLRFTWYNEFVRCEGGEGHVHLEVSAALGRGNAPERRAAFIGRGSCLKTAHMRRHGGQFLSNQAMLLARVERAAIRLAEELGYEWIDLELVKEPAGRFLRFFIDKEGGITLDEIEAYHRRIQPEAEDVDYDYMEVSSPGVDRPLKKPRDFERAAGSLVEVKLFKPLNGAKVWQGELKGLADGKIVICREDGEMAFDPKTVALVRPIVNIDEELLADELPGEEF